MRKFIVGVAIGFTFGYLYQLGSKIVLKEALDSDIIVRTELINWIVTDGVRLDPDEFRKKFAERATFINIITTRENS